MKFKQKKNFQKTFLIYKSSELILPDSSCSICDSETIPASSKFCTETFLSQPDLKNISALDFLDDEN